MAHARRGTQQGKPRGEPDVTIVEFAESQARRTTLVVLGILLIFALALATYVGVKQSLKQMRGVTMQSRLEAELRALEVWVAQRSNVVERWAEDEKTRALVSELVSLGAGHGSGSAREPQERPAGMAEVMVTLEQLALSHPWSQREAERWWQDYRREAANDMQERT